MTVPPPPTFTVGTALSWVLILAGAAAGWALYAMRRDRR